MMDLCVHESEHLTPLLFLFEILLEGDVCEIEDDAVWHVETYFHLLHDESFVAETVLDVVLYQVAELYLTLIKLDWVSYDIY